MFLTNAKKTHGAGLPVDLFSAIRRLKKEMNAVVLAHYYQIDEIQDIADIIGDSLYLARQAEKTTAEVIVFCGVHFMAETAKILNPEKTVLLPDLSAGCSLAESAPAKAFQKFIEAHPDHVVVTYVNSTAEVKALTDYCVTSTNAKAVIQSIPKDRKIIFAPDKHLGRYLSEELGRDLLCWDGTCEVHVRFSERELIRLIQNYPQALVVAHPECDRKILQHADYVGSTSGILRTVRESNRKSFIVVTEPGIIHQMKRDNPNKQYICAPAKADNQSGACISCNTCPHMKRNTLDRLYLCMQNRAPEVRMSESLMQKARMPIERMLAIG